MHEVVWAIRAGRSLMRCITSRISAASGAPADQAEVLCYALPDLVASKRRKFGSAPCSDLLSRSDSVMLRFAIAVVLHVCLNTVTWNHTVAFLSKALWIYTTTRDTTPVGAVGVASQGCVIAVEHEPDMRWVDLCLCHDVTLVWPARYWMLT
jgi:hypothetical protein